MEKKRAALALGAAWVAFAGGFIVFEGLAEGSSSGDPFLARGGDSGPTTQASVARVSPEEARKKVQSNQALLVCAYDDDAKFAAAKLEGAISWKELLAKLPTLDKRTEIILYCG